jgi:RND superfamily putative drug exporter
MMLANMGSFLYRRRIIALCVSLILVIGVVSYGLGVFGFLNARNAGVDNSESAQAMQLNQTKFGNTSTDVVLLLRSNSLKVTDTTFMQAATALLSTLKNRPEVASLTSYYGTQSLNFVSRDEHETFVQIRLKGQAQDFFTKKREYTSLKPFITSQTLEVLTGGSIPASIASSQQASNDLQQAEIFTLPVLVVLLLLVFGGVVATVLPLLIGIVAIMGAFALLRVFANVTAVSPFAINVVTMLGLGVAIDYVLFMLTRFREELSYNEQDVRGALERTMATAGRTVIFSALTVSTSLLGLLLFPLSTLRSLGLGAISVILVVMFVALTILPVLLALLGRRVNALPLRRIAKSRRTPGATAPGAIHEGGRQGVWYRLSEVVMRWPIPVTLFVLIILVTLVIPFLHIKLATTDINILPANQEARVVSSRLSQDFAHQGNAQLTIIIQTPGNALSPDSLTSLDRYVRSVQALSGVVQVQSLVTVSPDLDLPSYQRLYANPGLDRQVDQAATKLANGNFSQMTVAIGPANHTSEATNLVKQIRALHTSGGLTASVDGITPEEIDLLASIETTLPSVLLVIIASTFVLLFLMTGSLVMPLKAIFLNMLSLSATFGGLVWIFQDGHLQNLLHFELFGSIEAVQPVVIFAIAFGLSMDYEVFVLSRIKEYFDKTGNNRRAVSLGIQSTGWLVTSAALLLAVVLLGFGAAKTISVQEVGIGLALAVIMDATLIRTLLLPATMRLLGTFNWWAPAPLRWLWQYIGLKETAPTPALSPVFQVQANSDEHVADPLQSTGSAPVQPRPLEISIANDHEKGTSQWSGSKSFSKVLLLPVKQIVVFSEEGHLAGRPHIISTLSANSEQVMGPEILLWSYPNNDIVDGTLLQVESHQFCVLKCAGTILNVYEAGRYIVEPPKLLLLDSMQVGSNGSSIPCQYEALYINRKNLVVKVTGTALSREVAEVAYSVDYSLHVATREDAVKLIEHIPYRGHTLSTQALNAYTGLAIEQAVNQIMQATPLLHMLEKRKELSQLVYRQLQQLLLSYGITLDEVNVLVTPRDEHIKALLSLRAFGLSKAEAMRYYTVLMEKNRLYSDSGIDSQG